MAQLSVNYISAFLLLGKGQGDASPSSASARADAQQLRDASPFHLSIFSLRLARICLCSRRVMHCICFKICVFDLEICFFGFRVFPRRLNRFLKCFRKLLRKLLGFRKGSAKVPHKLLGSRNGSAKVSSQLLVIGAWVVSSLINEIVDMTGGPGAECIKYKSRWGGRARLH